MAEGGGRACFLLESRHAELIAREAGRQDFDGDLAAQAGVVGEPDLAHAPGSDGRGDLVGAEASTSLNCMQWAADRSFLQQPVRAAGEGPRLAVRCRV